MTSITRYPGGRFFDSGFSAACADLLKVAGTRLAESQLDYRMSVRRDFTLTQEFSEDVPVAEHTTVRYR
jgi:hypothetical protein